jgi:hypothetical protein
MLRDLGALKEAGKESLNGCSVYGPDRHRSNPARGSIRAMPEGEVEQIELVKQFGDVAAVDGMDLHIPGGEFF